MSTPHRPSNPKWNLKQPAPCHEDDASAVVAVCMLVVAFGVGVVVGMVVGML